MSTCPAPSDIPDSLQYVRPEVVRLYQRNPRVSFSFSVIGDLPAGTLFFAYVNTTIVSKDALPCAVNEYALTRDEVFEARSFAIVPVTPDVDYTGYDPLCGEEINTFANIERDFTLIDQKVVCPKVDFIETHFDTTRRHFVAVSDRKLGKTLRVGSTVRLKRRKRLIGRKTRIKPAGSPQKVLEVLDYRFCSDFDTSAFHTNPNIKCGCYPYPANATARYVRLAEGIFPIEEVEVLSI